MSANGRFISRWPISLLPWQGKRRSAGSGKKTTTVVTGGAGVRWISNETFAFSRELPDTRLRGTWLQTAGEDERRVSPHPYLAGKKGGFITRLPAVETVVFATKHGLFKMDPNGEKLSTVITTDIPPVNLIAVEDWHDCILK